MAMLTNIFDFVTTVIDGEKLKNTFNNHFLVVEQNPYSGKAEAGLNPGVIFTLMILEDNSPVKINKKTGLEKENNVYKNIEVTIPNKQFPLPFKKGDNVSLGKFMPEHSFFFDYNLILRYDDIFMYQPKGGSSNGTGTKQ